MTVYDTVMGTWVNGATVALPSGSNGDLLVMIAFTDSNPGSFTGWSLVSANASGAGPRRIYTRTRAGGETTVKLPAVVGVSDLSVYAILNVEAGVLYNDADFQSFMTSTWSISEAYNRDAPRFAFAMLDTDEAGLSVSGDFVEEHRINRASDPDNVAVTFVADEASGALDFVASGGWPSFGVTSWLVAFFSPEVAVTGRKWWLGVAGWG